MTMNNDGSDIRVSSLDVEHELPAAPENGNENARPEQQEGTSREQSAKGTDLGEADDDRKALRDRMARLQADFENSRKRAAREQQEFREFALADALKSLLPILDSLDRAIRAPAQSVEELRCGIELIRKLFEDSLARLGANPIPAKGEPFDPRVHQAVEMTDTTTAADNQVLEELQPGYRLQDRLLRPAMVRVARHPKHRSHPEAA
jgi:molecular chaperone GrpE